MGLRSLAGWLFSGDDEVDDAGRVLRPDEEGALLARCRAGDTAAFDALVTAYGSMVFNVAYRQLGDREEALDLSQEVFLRVYRKVGSFRGDSSFKTWIFRIVVNLARNRHKWWRVRRRDQTVSLDAPLAPGEPDGPLASDRLADDRQDPERDARNRDLERLVMEGMQRLSFEHRQILVMRDIEDLAYDQIAQVLGISEGTVKSRISRARGQLKEVLGGRL